MYAYRVLDELTFVKMQWVNEGYTVLLRTYIVCICSRTSRRPKALHDIIYILCTVCMPTEQLAGLQLWTDAIGQSRGVLHEALLYIVLVCSWTSQRVKLCKDIMNMLHTVYCMCLLSARWAHLCRDAMGQ